jgi:peptidoglycan/xylan/chitin deacetylase (PgdA/CDA1 family)
LAVAAQAQALERLASTGDELASHSYSHYYDLTRRSAAEMRAEIERGVAAVQSLTASKVAGFRAPGYVTSDTLLSLLLDCGLRYDSSVFPCPAYYGLKVARLAYLQAQRRKSSAIFDRPDVLLAPTQPYRVGTPYWFRGAGIWEIPVQVTRRGRLPFIGTALTTAGRVGARLLALGVAGEPFINLELHGIDLLDEQDGLQDLSKHQHDLKIPWAKKLAAIDAAISALRKKGYTCVRMDELARRAASA